MRSHLTLLLPPAVLLWAALCAAEPPAPGPSRPDHAATEIEALVRQLGHESFEVRRAATERLLDRPDAAPALRRAMKSDDPEVANRARAILEGQARREEKRALEQLAGYANNGEIDLAVELLVRRERWADEEAAWKVLTDLAGRLIERGQKEFGKAAVPNSQDSPLPAGNLTRYREVYHPKLKTAGRIPGSGQRDAQGRSYEPIWSRAEEIEMSHCGADMLVASAGVKRAADSSDRGRLLNSVVFAGGSVLLDDDAAASVVVCDGDFTTHRADCCLIIARGDVRIRDSGTDNQILVSGAVTFGEKNAPKWNQIKQKQNNPLGFVKWFDPASVGVVVEQADGGVKVKQADEDKPFARAGLRVGDLAVAADGKKIDSPESFRRLLRAKVVMGEELTLEVRRDGKPVKLTVDLAPPEPPKK